MMLQRKTQRIRITPARAKKVEKRYGRQLRRIASYIDTIVRGFDVEDETVYPSIVTALRRYANTLDEWAVSTARSVLTEIETRDRQTWTEYAQNLSTGLRQEIRNAPTGKVFSELLGEHVRLIKSLPLGAAQRIQDLATESVTDGARRGQIVQMIMDSGQVSKARATAIARTTVSTASTKFTQARAQHIGSEGYFWRISGVNTRPSHYKMRDKFVRWDSPPTLDNLTGHAGCLPNCDCYAEPAIPDDL